MIKRLNVVFWQESEDKFVGERYAQDSVVRYLCLYADRSSVSGKEKSHRSSFVDTSSAVPSIFWSNPIFSFWEHDVHQIDSVCA